MNGLFLGLWRTVTLKILWMSHFYGYKVRAEDYGSSIRVYF